MSHGIAGFAQLLNVSALATDPAAGYLLVAMRFLPTLLTALLMLSLGACKKGDSPKGPPLPASSDPTGKDLKAGAVVIAPEKGGGVRIYKITKVNFFPPPMNDELVMTAYNEKGRDLQHAAALWRQGGLTIALVKGRVYRNAFRSRDYRIIDRVAITDADHAAKAEPPKRTKAP